MFVAFFIGTIEILGLIGQEYNLTGGFWSFMENFDINKAGFVIVGIFVLTWAVALYVWHFGHIEQRWGGRRQGQHPRLAAPLTASVAIAPMQRRRARDSRAGAGSALAWVRFTLPVPARHITPVRWTVPGQDAVEGSPAGMVAPWHAPYGSAEPHGQSWSSVTAPVGWSQPAAAEPFA